MFNVYYKCSVFSNFKFAPTIKTGTEFCSKNNALSVVGQGSVFRFALNFWSFTNIPSEEDVNQPLFASFRYFLFSVVYFSVTHI